MEYYGFFQSWLAVLCAIAGTIIWRIARIFLASRMPVRWADNGMGKHDGLCDGSGGSVAYSCASYWRLGNKQPSSAAG